MLKQHSFSSAAFRETQQFSHLSRRLSLIYGELSKVVSCVFKHVSLFDIAKYEALSYARDEHTTAGAEAIYCHDALLWIQPNLALVLRILRHPNKDLPTTAFYLEQWPIPGSWHFPLSFVSRYTVPLDIPQPVRISCFWENLSARP